MTEAPLAGFYHSASQFSPLTGRESMAKWMMYLL